MLATLAFGHRACPPGGGVSAGVLRRLQPAAPPPPADDDDTAAEHRVPAAMQPGAVPAAMRLPGVAVVAIACGGHHTLLLSAAGHAYACGLNTAGQCGLPGAAGARVAEPQRLTAWDGLVGGGGSGGGVVAAVAAGRWHSLFLTTPAGGSDVYSCGGGAHGQLGHPYALLPRASGGGGGGSGGANGGASGNGGGGRDEDDDDNDPLGAGAPPGPIPPGLAQGAVRGSEPVPRLVTAGALAPGGGDDDDDGDTVVAIAAGAKHSACLTRAGGVLVWGQACLPVAAPHPAPLGAVGGAHGFAAARQSWLLQRYTLVPTPVPLGAVLRDLLPQGSTPSPRDTELAAGPLVSSTGQQPASATGQPAVLQGVVPSQRRLPPPPHRGLPPPPPAATAPGGALGCCGAEQPPELDVCHVRVELQQSEVPEAGRAPPRGPPAAATPVARELRCGDGWTEVVAVVALVVDVHSPFAASCATRTIDDVVGGAREPVDVGAISCER